MSSPELRGINAIEDVFVAGRSAIDLTELPLPNLDAAERFLRGYGFDLQIESQAQEAEALRQQAVDFLEEVLLEGRQLPEQLRRERDLRRLLVWASNSEHHLRPWACALLRVAHTHAHAQVYFDAEFGRVAQAQIVERFEAHVHREGDRLVMGEGPGSIELAAFETRPRKTLRAVVLKLLKAAENVAAPIYDHIGVRIVTRHRYGCLRVIHYLERHDVVTFANIVPTRTRNSLIDLQWIRAVEEGLRRAGQDAEQREATLRRVLEAHARGAGVHTEYNPQSAAEYRAIQFTGRELVRARTPDGGHRRVFQPYEVQVLDAAAHRRNGEGISSHRAYKARQLEVVRRRVLGPLWPSLAPPKSSSERV